MVSFEEFQKIELKVGTIKSAEPHPKADKLLVLKVDLGGEERQLVAGIKKYYGIDDLIGKKIIVVANLEPAVLRGVESQGMLLAAEDAEGAVRLLTVDGDISNGANVH
ncbi:MAG: methionine--tRNA ligase subunit beta [Candidatus Nanoarchaeia archaeon]|nr:methionine--tRNA ligase subunit beta [Candidatus Nanoarchaeia archaeon]MDD5239331.1 methionine--tRNA ligase subunit beta [Candidatus Nanoarchaeia archaeon]